MNTKVLVLVSVYVDLLVFCGRVEELLKEKEKTIGELAKYLAYFGGRKRLVEVLNSDEKIFDDSDEAMRKRRRDVIALTEQANSIAYFLEVNVFELVGPAAPAQKAPSSIPFGVVNVFTPMEPTQMP